MTTQDAITDDIFQNGRTFLPGDRPTSREEIIQSMNGDLYIDGVTTEEAQLMLSTLPRGAERLLLTPMDKGLSGSKVYAVRYKGDEGEYSKPFVFKIGALRKIVQEAEAVERLAAPFLGGIGTPIYRKSVNLGLLGQELHGMVENSPPESLRLHVRHADRADLVVDRLLRRRLAGWYDRKESSDQRFDISYLFQWHLEKMNSAPNAGEYPQQWEQLQSWVQEASGLPWHGTNTIIQSLAQDAITSPATIIHGDLHSQNVLVECQQGECWPIDFAWCRRRASPVLDCVMLECSLKFLSIPMRSNLRALLALESSLLKEPYPAFILGSVPYRPEIRNASKAVLAIRHYALDDIKVSFEDYRKCLCFMTYTLSNHPGLNLPYVLSSLQMATSVVADGI